MYFRPLFRRALRCNLRPCIMPSWHSHPENHDAICSDPVERLAPMSQHEVETAYQVAQKGSEAFPVICGPAATSFWHDQQTRCGGRAMSESGRATSPDEPL